MEKFQGKNGSQFAYDPEMTTPILFIEPGKGEGESTKVTQLDASDVLEFAEYLFNKARYESVARLRISAGDVLLIRTPNGISMEGLKRIEQGVYDQILKPLGLADSVTVVTLDGALDLEVVEAD